MRLRRAARHRQDVSQIEMQMIVGLTTARAERPSPRAWKYLAGEGRVPLDRFAVVEIDVADAVNVHRRAPAVRRRVHAQRMSRGPVSAVGGDVYERSYRLAESLERRSEQRDRARDVTRKSSKRRGFADVRLDELPQGE